MMRDDLGEPYQGSPARVVSLVPSLTEAVAVSAPGLLVGATDWCTHPQRLDVTRVGGTRYPDLEKVRDCRPDLVLANAEENRREDVLALREAGVPVWVTYPRDLDAAFDSLRRVFQALGVARPGWLDQAESVWSSHPEVVRRAVVPVWRRPWVVLGSSTFAGDLLRRLGVHNIYADSPERYPRPTPEMMLARRPDLVVLPDEPYRFTADDGPESFPGIPYALVSGRHLTWYGPSLVEARTLLVQQLAAAPG
jgi:ABC-type Fe3+-hydroxamate transport system substrate-binding protein